MRDDMLRELLCKLGAEGRASESNSIGQSLVWVPSKASVVFMSKKFNLHCLVLGDESYGFKRDIIKEHLIIIQSN